MSEISAISLLIFPHSHDPKLSVLLECKGSMFSSCKKHAAIVIYVLNIRIFINYHTLIFVHIDKTVAVTAERYAVNASEEGDRCFECIIVLP